MDTIHTKNITMRPRIYFLIGSTLTILGIALTTCIASLAIALVWFRIQADAPLSYLHFGFPGLNPFFSTMPWRLLLLAIIATALGLRLLRKYDHTYKYRFIPVVMGSIIGVLAIGSLLHAINIHKPLRMVPPVQTLYENKTSGKRWIVGTISQRGDHPFIETRRGEHIRMRIIVTPIPEYTPDGIHHYRVIGKRDGETFYVTGLMPAPSPRHVND